MTEGSSSEGGFCLILHFFHPLQFPSCELHDDFVQFRALPQCLHPWCLRIGVDLLYRLLPLPFGLRLEILFGEVFDFYDVAVPRLVVREVGHQEEVAVAVVQLLLRCGEVVGGQAQG